MFVIHDVFLGRYWCCVALGLGGFLLSWRFLSAQWQNNFIKGKILSV